VSQRVAPALQRCARLVNPNCIFTGGQFGG
jgi:hypothetical protein